MTTPAHTPADIPADAPADSLDALLDALGALLVRRFRDSLYARLQPACPVALRDGTYPLLIALAAAPATAAQVGQRMGVDRTVASRQATVLLEAGLLERGPDPADARGTLLTLTPQGRRAAEDLRRSARELLEQLLAGFPDDALDQAVLVLDRLATLDRRR